MLFFPHPPSVHTFTDYETASQPSGMGGWWEMGTALCSYLFILATLHFILSKNRSQAFTVCEKGEKQMSAPLLLNYSTWNYLGRCGQLLYLWNESISTVCRWPSLWTQRRDVSHTLNKIKLAWFLRQDFVDKIKNTKPYIKNYFHFQLLLDLCV